MATDVSPKYHLITYGCQMNKNDSERAEALLKGIGFASAETPEEADVILINSCSVRQTAEDRIFGQMKNFSELRLQKPTLLLGVTGCMPGRDRDGKLRAKLPMVDFFFPISDLPQLPRWLAEHAPTLVKTTDAPEDYLKITPSRRSVRQSFVTIQTGCNKFCTYCVVPFSRGLEKNRPVADILAEVRDLADHGCVEVTLLGQTVNAYKATDPEAFSKDNPYKDHFAALLWEVHQVPGIERIHYTAPHPIHMTEEVIDALALPKHVRYLHLPVQVGSNEVLRRMNRRYTREFYLDLVKKIRARVPEIALGTDIIVGFAGETAEQFAETASLYREADFDISYTAQYSPRTGTAAFRAFPDTVTREEKKERWNALQKIMEEIVLKKNQALIGKTVRVLVETVGPMKSFNQAQDGNSAGRFIAEGNCEYMKRVRFAIGEYGSKGVGEFFHVKITKAREWVLEGEVVSHSIKNIHVSSSMG
jgi:tRNA-2-methylthio-N6-dimethylallyladenosine synthase